MKVVVGGYGHLEHSEGVERSRPWKKSDVKSMIVGGSN